jgi:hypothetical protein
MARRKRSTSDGNAIGIRNMKCTYFSQAYRNALIELQARQNAVETPPLNRSAITASNV